MTSLLKIRFATLKQTKLNFVLMKCIKTNDGIHDIIYNEKCDVHDYSMSDIRDHLLTFDLDLSTIHIDELTCMRSDWYMRCKRWRCYWRDSSCVYECCPELLKMLRETGTYCVRKWSTSLFDPWFWASDRWIRLLGNTWQSETEQKTLTLMCWSLTLTLMLKLLSCRS